MHHIMGPSAAEALERLQKGNARHLNSDVDQGDVSRARRRYLSEHGQSPYAIIVACSDSRVIPESIFSAGLGELFVIRVAGNVIGEQQLGSIQYAWEHLGCRLVVVLGHTGCGAVAAALEGGAEGFIASITDVIRLAIGTERDACRASCLNAAAGVETIKRALKIDDEDPEGLHAVGALVHLDTGRVEFLD